MEDRKMAFSGLSVSAYASGAAHSLTKYAGHQINGDHRECMQMMTHQILEGEVEMKAILLARLINLFVAVNYLLQLITLL